MKPILVVIHSPTWFIEMFRVARVLKESAEYEPLIFWAARHHRIEHEVAACMEAGLRCLDLEGNLLSTDQPDDVFIMQSQMAPDSSKQSARQRLSILPLWIRVPAQRFARVFSLLLRRLRIAWRRTSIYSGGETASHGATPNWQLTAEPRRS